MNEVFYESPLHGTLIIDSVYEFYEEPRLFSVSNEVGNVFVVYWATTDEDSDTWFLIPISRDKLYQFEMKQVCIRDVLLYQEKKNFVKLIMPFDEVEEIQSEFVSADIIQDLITLPLQGVYISSSPHAVLAKSPALVEATHEIHIQKNSKNAKDLYIETVFRIVESFSELYSTLSESFVGGTGLEAVGARTGSFILSFNAKHSELIDSTLSELFCLIRERESVIPFIESNNINAPALCELLSRIVNSHSNFDLKQNSDSNSLIKISSDDAKYYIKTLNNYVSIIVSSSQVPQANDLKKLFEIVEKLSNGIELTESDLSLTKRQIQYYLHAASTLGFTQSYGSITSLGQEIANAEYSTRLIITARAFQYSHCGWAWVKWSGVSDITELDASTAADFLIENCSSLSENTAKRRSTTLKKWCNTLSAVYTGV